MFKIQSWELRLKLFHIFDILPNKAIGLKICYAGMNELRAIRTACISINKYELIVCTSLCRENNPRKEREVTGTFGKIKIINKSFCKWMVFGKMALFQDKAFS
jgi:hypothetical protein